MTKSKTQAKAHAHGAAEDVAAVPAGAPVTVKTGTPAPATARPRRRPPLSLLALAGAAVAAAYGYFALGMRVGPPLVMVGIGGLTLAFCAAALWRVIDPLTRNEVALVPEARAPHRLRELEREKQAVLKAIKEIELDFQMRKISEADYREMVERYRARALRIMGDLAAGDDYRALIERELKDRLAVRAATGVAEDDSQPAPVPAAADRGAQTAPAAQMTAAAGGGVCTACATTNDSDALFCKKCGTTMASPVVSG